MGEWRYSPTGLNLGTRWNSRLCRFIPRETAPGTHWIGGWVALTDGLDATEKGHFLLLLGIEPRLLYRPAPSLIAIPTEVFLPLLLAY
jgi:hypothetical protein